MDAFKLRMIADVPVGVFLSGGIDSSLLTALLQKHAGQRIKTFTIAFDSVEHNEAPYAEAVASHFGTDHHTRMLKGEEAMNMLPRWGDLYDEPFGDDSGIPTFLVSRVASEHVKVVLSADGGDELFSGYESYTSVLAQVQEGATQPYRGPRSLARHALARVPWDRLDDVRQIVSARVDTRDCGGGPVLRACASCAIGVRCERWVNASSTACPSGSVPSSTDCWDAPCLPPGVPTATRTPALPERGCACGTCTTTFRAMS